MEKTPASYDAHLERFRRTAHVRSLAQYQDLYKRSLEDVENFWSEKAREYLSWIAQWDFAFREDPEEAVIEWFGGGLINASYNCLDRHLEKSADKACYYWEGDNPSESRVVTYMEMHRSVNRLAALLRSRGVAKGDRVIIYMPAVVELSVAMLACARIGAVHSVVFTGYSAESLVHRIGDCAARAVITADGFYRKGKAFPLKTEVDKALLRCPEVDTVVVLNRCNTDVMLVPERDIRWEQALPGRSAEEQVPPEPMSAEDLLFILFAGGSTGLPRPLVHTHGGYLLWAAMTTHLIFDLCPDDTFWCTSDTGWITGHTFGVYGPLLNGISSVMFEGVPNFPDHGRYCEIIDKYRVNKFCTEPTVIRTLAANGTRHLQEHDLSSLEILGSCAEPMPPGTWQWYYKHVGKERCPIMDTWWQTESGGPMMTPLPGVGPLKPGSVSMPFFGVQPVILDLDTGEETRFPHQEGAFFIKRPWPGMARTIFRDHEAYKESYFAPFQGLFLTGDGAWKDEDGFYRMLGRIDDVINVAGHRIAAWEIESALVSHPDVVEVAVVGFPHETKGQGLYAFITLRAGSERSDQLRQALIGLAESRIGGLAVPDVIQWAQALPKTRSGKILRRLLQKIAAGQVTDLGDTTTVANPDAVSALITDRLGIEG